MDKLLSIDRLQNYDRYPINCNVHEHIHKFVQVFGSFCISLNQLQNE